MTVPATLAGSETDLGTLYARVRTATEELARPLHVEDMVVQSMADASPTKWNLAHTSWFFETFVLARRVPGYRLFDPRFPALFNSYYHAAGERHPRSDRGLLSRPTVAEVRSYRRHVDGVMGALLAGEHGSLEPEVRFRIELGLNHEEQHQELLLTDIKHVLALSPLEPAYRPPSTGVAQATAGPAGEPPVTSVPEADWISFDGGLLELGAEPSGFAFDNERPRHRRWCEPYELASRLVTAGEYLEFMGDGGYERSDLWLSDGWDARTRESWEAPLYWKHDERGWRQVTLDGPRPVDPAEPVCHLSLYEADAYARWKGARLPLEEEWEHAVREQPIRGNLLESGRLHPAAAAGEPAGARRLDQAFGDAWEWTASPYAPYPGFRPFAGEIGEYNGKWMSNRYILRGGSCATPVRHLRHSYRNFFGPEARWQFTGLRLARGPE